MAQIAKEKALELVKIMLKASTNVQDGVNKTDYIMAKNCAVFAVDEILSEFNDFNSFCIPKDEEAYNYVKEKINFYIKYFKKVKREIENL